MRDHRLGMGVGATLAGLAALGGAYMLDDGSRGAWWSGVLVNGGTVVVLLVPLWAFTERLGRRIEGVRQEAAQSVVYLTERVETFEREVGQRLDDVAAAVERGLTEERQRDKAAIQRLGEEVTRDVVFEAVERAVELGLISRERGPRVPVAPDSDTHLRFNYDVDDWAGRVVLFLALESEMGQHIEGLPWGEGESATEVFSRLGRVVHRVEPRADLDVGWVMTRLRDTLDVALRDEAFRPILQLCPPQWCVTEAGAVAYGNEYPYTVTTARIPELSAHVLSKPWVDGDSFHDAITVAPYICPRVYDSDEPPF